MTAKIEPFFSVCLIVNLERLDLINAAVEPHFENFATSQELIVYGRSRFGRNNVGQFDNGIGIDAQINGVNFTEAAGGLHCHITKLSITQHSFANVIWFEDYESYNFGQINIFLNDDEINTLIEYMKAGFKTVHFTLFTDLGEQKKNPFFNSKSAPTHIDYEIWGTRPEFTKFEKFQFNLNNRIGSRDYYIYFRTRLSRFFYEDRPENTDYPDQI